MIVNVKLIITQSSPTSCHPEYQKWIASGGSGSWWNSSKFFKKKCIVLAWEMSCKLRGSRVCIVVRFLTDWGYFLIQHCIHWKQWLGSNSSYHNHNLCYHSVRQSDKEVDSQGKIRVILNRFRTSNQAKKVSTQKEYGNKRVQNYQGC